MAKKYYILFLDVFIILQVITNEAMTFNFENFLRHKIIKKSEAIPEQNSDKILNADFKTLRENVMFGKDFKEENSKQTKRNSRSIEEIKMKNEYIINFPDKNSSIQLIETRLIKDIKNELKNKSMENEDTSNYVTTEQELVTEIENFSTLQDNEIYVTEKMNASEMNNEIQYTMNKNIIPEFTTMTTESEINDKEITNTVYSDKTSEFSTEIFETETVVIIQDAETSNKDQAYDVLKTEISINELETIADDNQMVISNETVIENEPLDKFIKENATFGTGFKGQHKHYNHLHKLKENLYLMKNSMLEHKHSSHLQNDANVDLSLKDKNSKELDFQIYGVENMLSTHRPSFYLKRNEEADNQILINIQFRNGTSKTYNISSQKQFPFTIMPDDNIHYVEVLLRNPNQAVKIARSKNGKIVKENLLFVEENNENVNQKLKKDVRNKLTFDNEFTDESSKNEKIAKQNKFNEHSFAKNKRKVDKNRKIRLTNSRTGNKINNGNDQNKIIGFAFLGGSQNDIINPKELLKNKNAPPPIYKVIKRSQKKESFPLQNLQKQQLTGSNGVAQSVLDEVGSYSKNSLLIDKLPNSLAREKKKRYKDTHFLSIRQIFNEESKMNKPLDFIETKKYEQNGGKKKKDISSLSKRSYRKLNRKKRSIVENGRKLQLEGETVDNKVYAYNWPNSSTLYKLTVIPDFSEYLIVDTNTSQMSKYNENYKNTTIIYLFKISNKTQIKSGDPINQFEKNNHQLASNISNIRSIFISDLLNTFNNTIIELKQSIRIYYLVWFTETSTVRAFIRWLCLTIIFSIFLKMMYETFKKK